MELQFSPKRRKLNHLARMPVWGECVGVVLLWCYEQLSLKRVCTEVMVKDSEQIAGNGGTELGKCVCGVCISIGG